MKKKMTTEAMKIHNVLSALCTHIYVEENGIFRCLCA